MEKSNAEKNKIGTQIRKRKNMLKLTTTQLAESVGISKGYMSQIETNIKLPQMEIFFKICQELDIHPHEVLNFAHSENKLGIEESFVATNKHIEDYRKCVDIIEEKLYPSPESVVNNVAKAIKEIK